MRDRINIAERLLVRQALKLMWVLPVRRRRILFESFDGASCSCNPKYLSDYLKEHYPGEYELVWSFSDPSKFSGEEGIRPVRKRSLKWFLAYLTAGVRITNASNQMTFFPKRKGQLVINTWHAGGAYKRTGIVSEYVQRDSDFKKWRRREQAAQFDLFLSSSPPFTRTNVREAYLFEGPVLKSGMPRNDLFFDAARVRRAAEKVRKTLGISGPIVLYAPTYRGSFNETEAFPALPVDVLAKSYAERYGERPVILIRAHYAERDRLFDLYGGERTEAESADETAFGGDRTAADRPRLVDVTDYPDMQELLAAADLLVTDYSSSIWDYALLGRPCLLYVPDLAHYEREDRGFFTPIAEWPGLIARDAAELRERLLGLDEAVCREKAEAHLQRFHSYERGKACEMTVRVMRHFARTGKIR